MGTDTVYPKTSKHFPIEIDNEIIKCGNKFDDVCESLQWNECYNCNTSIMEVFSNCDLCNKCKNNFDKFSVRNNMDPKSLPEELKNLSEMEKMIIALVHPIISVYRIKGAQHGYTSNVINFYQNVSNFTQQLPHRPEDIPAFIVIDKDTQSGTQGHFKVNKDSILNALTWLKKNNPYYNDIEINEEYLKIYPKNGHINSLLRTVELTEKQKQLFNDDKIEESFVPSHTEPTQDELIENELHLKYPTLDSTPVNEFTDTGYITKAFPHLFPYGCADFLQQRDIKVSRDDYFKHLMNYKDHRFAQDFRFRYFAFNTIQRHKLIRNHGYTQSVENLEICPFPNLKVLMKKIHPL